MNLKLKRTPGIYILGFMGAGKTTVGRLLADRLGWRFIDVDERIEAAEGVAISEIFETRGEPEFRRIETEAIRAVVEDVERGHPAVVALGGGAFAQPANRELLEENGVTIWLDCPLDMVQRRVAREAHRPLARDPEHFEHLYHARREHYAAADIRIAVESDDPEAAVSAILALPVFR